MAVTGTTREDSTRTFDCDDGDYDSIGSAEAPRLIVALSCKTPLVPGIRISLTSAREVYLRRGTRLDVARTGGRVDLSLDDEALSRQHAVLRRVVGGWELEDLGSKNGTVVSGDRFMRTTLTDGDLIEIGSTLLVFRETDVGNQGVRELADRDLSFQGESDAPPVFRTMVLDLERRLADMAQIAPSQLPVLVRGETGTGKELIARAVHDLSARRGPFIAINCGALPRTLVESELFGYRRGAFSDAREDRDGLVRRAHGGTLFLDEVAELPAESQVALLRVLQEGEVRPLGASDHVAVDVRVVAATHQDIQQRIAGGQFRQDLYARLAGFQLVLPPLRDRREDLGILVAAILRRIGTPAEQVTLHRQAARALFCYGYPLNIRELEQALRAAVVFSHGEQIRAEHLPENIRHCRPLTHMAIRPEDQALRQRLHEILSETRGNVAAAARMLNKAPIQVRRWCRRLSIDLASFRM
jgi:transcriptional regulator of aromatic amino acid metabolism